MRDAEAGRFGAGARLGGHDILKNKAPQLLSDILEMSAFVNHRRVEAGEPAILSISAHSYHNVRLRPIADISAMAMLRP